MLIAVTGCRGQVGRAVVKDLLAHGYSVRALMRTPWAECPDACEKVENLDLTDFDGVKEAIRGCDAVIHIANIPGPLDDDRPETFVNNVTVNFNMIMACGLLGINRLAIAGSNCAGGYCRNYHYPDPPYFPLDENSPCNPDDTYGMSKLVSELVAQRLCQRFPELRVVTLRISWVTGPEFYARAAEKENKNPLNSYYGNLGTFIDERDAAAAFRRCIEADLPNGAHVYYICYEETQAEAPVAQFLAKEFPNVPLKAPMGEFQALESCEKAWRELDWRAQYSWKEEVAKLRQK